MTAFPCPGCGRLLGPDPACAACGRPTAGAPDWSPPYAPRPALAPGGGSYAAWWQRFAAWLLDVAGMLTAIATLEFAALALSGALPADGGDVDQDRAGLAILVLFVLGIAGLAVYSIVMVGRYEQTLGKRALGLVVRGEDGARCGYGRAANRELLGRLLVEGLSTLLAGAGVISYLLAANDRKGITWHDRIAGTIVVRDTPRAR